MKSNRLSRVFPRAWVRAAGVVLLGAALSGCASTISSRVTTFQQWPADAVGATYAIAPSEAQRDSLEFQQYAEEARGAMSPTGLTEARAGEQARFAVSLAYGMTPINVAVQRPIANPIPVAPRAVPYRGRDGRIYYQWVQPYPFGAYGAYGPSWETSSVPAFRHELKVEIRDQSRGNEKVYESTAVHTTGSDSQPEVMPWLLRSIFDHFPDGNGQVREVNYEVR